MKFNEKYTVENHIIKFLKERLGYAYVAPTEFAKLREFEHEYVVAPLLLEAVKQINSIDDDEAQTVVREVKKIDSNEAFLDALRNGVNIKDQYTGKMRGYALVDFEHLEQNRFTVTNQFYFEGNAENIRTDIMVFLNGIPVVDIEAKSPTARGNVDYVSAIGQLKRYERNAFKLYWPNCFNIATDGLKTVYGATYAPPQFFLEWKDRQNGDAVEAREGSEGLECTLAGLLEKKRLLDVIQNFILFEKEKEQTVKKIARYQQLRAANKIVERVLEGTKKHGLIWHTQGSGKSLTMFFTAWKLRYHPALKNPKVFVLVDRIDLNDQIFDTFVACGGENVEYVASEADLARKIRGKVKGIFITTIQKFDHMLTTEDLSENIIVLADEAHRSEEGISAINLRSALKNAFFFGFTGTPIDKKTLNTHKNFGTDGERYLDYYSIKQAIDDGATVPVTYEARLSNFFIDEARLDAQFDALTYGFSENEKDALAKRYGKKEAVVKLDARMQAIARDIVEHFRLYVEPSGFKAQIVCYDREATARYKECIDALVSSTMSAVVFSDGDPNTDAETFRLHKTTKAEREKIIRDFKDPEHPLKLLLVCDMLLTGFDAPVEQVMYIDKPLRDHNLLQAIARTNRVYPNKGAGKIIDYYGITKNLHEALDFDERDIDSAMVNIDAVKEEFKEVLRETASLFDGIAIEDPSMENFRRCLKIFTDDTEKQQFFRNTYARLKLLFEVLSPDPFLKQYTKTFIWLVSFYVAFNKRYGEAKSDAVLLAEYGGKMKQLIQEHVDYEGITKNFRELNINDLYILERLNAMDDDDKAAALQKLLMGEIAIHIETNLAYQKLSERLVAINEAFEQHQIDLTERIKRYHELLKDITKKSEEAHDLGLSLKEYGLFTLSQEFVHAGDASIVADGGIATAPGSMVGNSPATRDFIKELTRRIERLLDPGWQESSKREEFLKEIKRIVQEMVLKDYKYEIRVNDFHKYLNRLVDLVLKKF